jgi:hypothetical protein
VIEGAVASVRYCFEAHTHTHTHTHTWPAQDVLSLHAGWLYVFEMWCGSTNKLLTCSSDSDCVVLHLACLRVTPLSFVHHLVVDPFAHLLACRRAHNRTQPRQNHTERIRPCQLTIGLADCWLIKASGGGNDGDGKQKCWAGGNTTIGYQLASENDECHK